MKDSTRNLLVLACAVMIVFALGSNLFPGTVISVSKLNIDPQGYEDPSSHEWKGSFWTIEMLVDVSDQVAGFHLGNEDGQPSSTYAETIDGKTYASSYSVSGNELVPTADVMVHVTPKQPYYERPLEIQQGYYVKEAFGRLLSGTNPRTADHADAVPFVHYSFGSGSWTLHTPFKVDVYKNGVLIGSQDIDTVGGTGIYRIPSSGEEYIHVTDLGKIGTGYNQPTWTDILYFSENQIFVRTTSADNFLRYDGGQSPTPYSGAGFPSDIIGTVSATSFSKYWYGQYRWLSDSTPTVVSLSNLPPGFYADGSTAKPRKPSVFPDSSGRLCVTQWLYQQGVPLVTMPSWLDHLEKTSNNQLRLYLPYGAASSWVTLKISTELADTIVWQPQVANFEITSFPNFGDIADTKPVSLTVKCVAGTGSATIFLSKSPSDIPASIPPTLGTPTLTSGQSHTVQFNILNLGTTTTRDFSVTATVKNSLGSVTDTATASGRLLMKTGATTILNVLTSYNGQPISGLPITIEYAGTQLSAVTGTSGSGLATFNLGTSSTVTVKASFYGNGVYLPSTQTVSVTGGTEKTVTLALTRENVPTDDYSTLLLALGLGGMATIVLLYWIRRKR